MCEAVRPEGWWLCSVCARVWEQGGAGSGRPLPGQHIAASR
jgi:hypothetical protein